MIINNDQNALRTRTLSQGSREQFSMSLSILVSNTGSFLGMHVCALHTVWCIYASRCSWDSFRASLWGRIQEYSLEGDARGSWWRCICTALYIQVVCDKQWGANGKCEHPTPSLGALACVHHLQIKFPAFRYQASCSGSCRQVISISLFSWSVKWNRTHFVENTKDLVT